MVDMVVVSAKENEYLSRIFEQNPSFSNLQKNITNYLTQKEQQPWPPEEKKEYLLFLDQNQLVGYSYLEGESDVKKATASYQILGKNPSLEIASEIIEKSTNHAFQYMTMLDVHWQAERDPSPFLLAAVSLGYEFCIDNDIVIYSQTYQEKLDLDNRKK